MLGLQRISAASAWCWYYFTRGLPLLFALCMLPVSYYVKVQDETTVGYTFRWIDWVCLEFPLVGVSLVYGIYSAKYPYSELTVRSRWWWNGAMFFRYTYYLLPLSMGIHSAATICTWCMTLLAWHETSSRRVWHRPVTHMERYCIYWPIGLTVSVTSGHVGECVSAFLAWRKYGSVGHIVVAMMLSITLLHALATMRFGINLGFLLGTVWETCIIMSVSLGHHNKHVFSTAGGCACFLLLLSAAKHYRAYRRNKAVPRAAIEFYEKTKKKEQEVIELNGSSPAMAKTTLVATKKTVTFGSVNTNIHPAAMTMTMMPGKRRKLAPLL